jgi:6-phosphogluconolactonase
LKNIAFKIAASIASTLEESVLKKGYATLVVSGGNSPVEIFAHLNQMLISWSKITVILGDDRMLDSANSDSNDKLIRENLIINKAGAAKYLSLIDPLVTPSKLNFPFDISLLGMGLDGHTASLFPNTKALDEKEALIVLNDVPQLSTQRITMTYPLLLNSKKIVMIAKGNEKKKVLENSLKMKFPVAILIPNLDLILN